MKHTITIIAVMLYASVTAQFSFNVGGFAANADNKNPINFGEITTWDGYKPGVIGDWATDAQLDEIKRRADGRFFGAALGVGYDLPILKFNANGLPSFVGITANTDLFIQTTQEQNSYDNAAFSPSVGVYADFGLRLDVGVMRFANTSNWYLDISGMITENLYVYTRYQRANPFTNELHSVFYDGTPTTLETASAGLRYIFHKKGRYNKRKEMKKEWEQNKLNQLKERDEKDTNRM